MIHTTYQREYRNFILWTLLYFGLVQIAGSIISKTLANVPHLFSVIFGAGLTSVVLLILKKTGTLAHYGFCNILKLDHRRLLYYAPLVVLASVNLWAGVYFSDNTLFVVLEVLLCLLVGFWEELLFRAFLVRMIKRKCSSETKTILISSVLFGSLHALNLFGGADILSTIFQVFYTASLGFMSSAFFVRTQNILPLMLFHACFNITSVFMSPNFSDGLAFWGTALTLLLSLGYGTYLLKRPKPLPLN